MKNLQLANCLGILKSLVHCSNTQFMLRYYHFVCDLNDAFINAYNTIS